jgi:hypothetical protein
MNTTPGADIDFKIAEIATDIVSMVERADKQENAIDHAKAEIAALRRGGWSAMGLNLFLFGTVLLWLAWLTWRMS